VSLYNITRKDTDKQQVSVKLEPINIAENPPYLSESRTVRFFEHEKKHSCCRIFTAGSGTNMVQAMTMDGDNDGVITK
jgi:hypothetical protein